MYPDFFNISAMLIINLTDNYQFFVRIKNLCICWYFCDSFIHFNTNEYFLGDPDINKAYFILSRKGNRQLVFSNCIHTKYRKNKNLVIWRCIDYYSEYKCKASLLTKNDVIVEIRYTHKHQCHSEKLARAEVESICIPIKQVSM